jgi:hypothetical protein
MTATLREERERRIEARILLMRCDGCIRVLYDVVADVSVFRTGHSCFIVIFKATDHAGKKAIRA